MRVKTVYVKDKQRLKLSDFPNFSVTGSITGIKRFTVRTHCLSVAAVGFIT